MPRNNWTREETIVAFNAYCKIPFKESSQAHPLVIEYANLIGRSPAALNMKIGNFGRLDPKLKEQGITGLVHGSKMDESVWAEFHRSWEALAYESEQIIERLSQSVDLSNHQESSRPTYTGFEKTTTVKQRVNQRFFRSAVLSAYNYKCAVTGLPLPELLVASHIVPWSKDPTQRLNPSNGLCLNALHDKAFDRGLITITTSFKVKLSAEITEYIERPVLQDFFMKYQEASINLPDKFLPSQEFLQYHRKHVFKG